MVASNAYPLGRLSLANKSYMTNVSCSTVSPPREPRYNLPNIDFPHSSKNIIHTIRKPIPMNSSNILLPPFEPKSTSPNTSIAMGIAAMSLRFIVHGEQSENQLLEEETNEVSVLNNQSPSFKNQMESMVDPISTVSRYHVESMLNPICAQPQCHRNIRGPVGSFCKYHKASRFCRIENCQKSAKTGGYCIGHGGGKRCMFTNCSKSAKQGGYCIAHGGGKRCSFPDCTKSALVGGCCSAHGGGHKCSTVHCTKIALVGGNCIAHGGGKRCQVAHCSKSAVGGVLCVAHGGGKRCQVSTCRKGAVRNGLCIRHGAKNDVQGAHLKSKTEWKA